MKRIFSLIVSFNILTFAFAQTNTQNVYGKVVDVENGAPLFGASVVVLNLDPIVGTITDLEGNYTLSNLPVGRITIQVSYMGYETATYPEILINSGKTFNLDVKLLESFNSIEEITITAEKKNSSTMQVQNEMATVSAMSFSLEQSSRYAGSINDPSRLVLSFPGVRNQGDIQNGISIRGNTPTSLLWNIEGLEIQSPNHFAREGALGAINMVSSNVLQGVDFYTAAFPAQYGNAGSGVFDLKTRKGNPDEYEFSLSAGIMGLEASAEGPFSKKYKGSFLLSYRYSTLSIFNKLGYDLIGNNAPVYQDLNYKFNLPTKKLGNFQIFGLYGDSEIRPIDKTYDGDWVDGYRLAVLGLKNTKRVSDKTLLNSSILYSQSKGSFYQYYSNPRFNNGYYKGYTETSENFPIIEKRFQIDLKTSTKVNAKHSFQTGVNVTYINFKQKFKEQKDRYNYNPSKDEISLNRTESDSTQAILKTFQIKAFMQHKLRLTERLNFIAGIHFITLNYTKFMSAEPRLGMEFNYGKRHQLNAGIGLHSRLEPLGYYGTEGKFPIEYDVFKNKITYNFGTPNQHLQAIKSVHFVLGNTFQLAPKLKFKAEVYYQYLYQIPVLDEDNFAQFNNSIFDYASVNYQYPSIYDNDFTQQLEYKNKGQGFNYGVDLSLEKAFAKNYYVLVNGSYYQSKYRTPSTESRYDLKWLNTRYNGNFIFTLTAGKDFTIGKDKNNTFSMNFRSVWAGNNRVFNVESQIPFDKKLENYFRLDTRLAYTRNKEKYAWTISLDLQNTTNKVNESSNPQINSVGVLPIINYKVEF